MAAPTWVLAGALASLAVTGLAAQEPRAAQRAAEAPALRPLEHGAGLELNRALRLARASNVPPAQLVQSIVRAGADVLGPSLTLLDERTLPSVDGGAAQVLSTDQESVLLAALRSMDRVLVWSAIDAHLAAPKGESTSISARAAALLAGGTCAEFFEIGRLAQLALGTDETELDSRIELALQAGVEDLFERRPSALDLLATSWRSFSPLLLPVLVQAAGAHGDPRALELLSQMLDQSTDLEAIALAELSRQTAPLTIPPELFPKLRGRLQSERAITCQAACTALAALGDFGSVEPMEELLSSSSAGVRTTAHRALCVLSGLSLPSQPSAWHAWRLHESRWFDEREQQLLDAIVDGEASEATAALSEIAAHRWERHRLSSIAAEGLRRDEASIREEAAGVLAQLNSPRARNVSQTAATRDAARPESKR